VNRDSPEKGAYGDGSPIAAFATPLAESALAVIRCSGDGAVELAAPFFSRPEKLKTAAGHSIVHGWIRHEGEKIDEVLVSVYRQPKSYTGEEGLDISCHGGIAAARGVMKILRKAGFRNALPGEFTFRAFMNGRIDLTRAESVMEMVSAKTGAGLRGAALRLSGALENEIRSLRDKLTDILAETEIYLDYSEDEFVPGGAEDPGGMAGEEGGGMPGRALAEEVLARLGALAASFKRERLYQDGALAVIAGKPNAGKSSLFNRLIGEDRAIVDEAPGTTRDFIEAWISIEGIPVRLADTAGLRDGLSPDSVENTGMDRSRALMAEADLVLCVTDGTEKYEHEKGFPFKGETPRLFIWNKADLPSCPAPPRGFLPVSAITGSGIPELCGAIAAALEKTAEGPHAPGGPGEMTGAAPGTQRQKELIDEAAAPLAEALDLADRGEPLDIIAPLLRESANALGEITGEVSSAGILEKMFSKFCVGK
jgi:tRNA modification GTPase